MKRWQFATIVLAILFAPPFLVIGTMQALLWLLYRLFPSAPFPAWLGIEGYAATVLGAHILISAGLMGLLVRRWRRPGRWQFVLTAVAVSLAMPFLAFWPLSLLMRLFYRLLPSASGWLFGIEMYPFLSTLLLSDLTRYVSLSLAALTLALAALTWLAAQERGRVWQHGRFYVLLAACASVLAFPFLMRYRPAVQSTPGVELRLVDEPGLLEGVVKSCQATAEVPGCQYEPLGWADAQTLIYRKWCGSHYNKMGIWHPGDPQPPRLTTWTRMRPCPSMETWTRFHRRPAPGRTASCPRWPQGSSSNRATTPANTGTPSSLPMAVGSPSPPSTSTGRRTCSSYRASERQYHIKLWGS